MNTKQLATTIETCVREDINLLVKGIPGVGKTDSVTQAAQRLGMDLMIEHPVVSDPTDYKGLPFPNADHSAATFLTFGSLQRMMQATDDLIVLIDDLGQAPQSVQAALMQLLLLREINGKRISDKVHFIACTNDRSHKAGVNQILEPVKGRFGTIVTLEPDLECWIEWALDNNMPIKLIAFNKARPQLFTSWQATSDLTNSPNPRNIASLGRLMNAGFPRESWHEVYSGAVGEAYATDLIGWLSICDDLPDIDLIILDPNNQPIPTEIGSMWATAAALAERMGNGSVDNIVTYLNRMEPEFGAVAMIGAIRRDPSLKNTRGWIEWATKNHQIIKGDD